jgi:hypothetical protein
MLEYEERALSLRSKAEFPKSEELHYSCFSELKNGTFDAFDEELKKFDKDDEKITDS